MDSGNSDGQSKRGGRAGRGRGDSPQDQYRGGRGRGRGRGDSPQDQYRGGYSGGQSPEQNYQGQGAGSNPWRRETGSSPGGQGVDSSPGGQERGTSVRGVEPERSGHVQSFRSVLVNEPVITTPSEPVAQSSAKTSSTPAIQPSSIAQVVKGVQSLTIEPKENVTGAESQGTKEGGASQDETSSGGTSESQSADEPKLSLSAQIVEGVQSLSIDESKDELADAESQKKKKKKKRKRKRKGRTSLEEIPTDEASDESQSVKEPEPSTPNADVQPPTSDVVQPSSVTQIEEGVQSLRDEPGDWEVSTRKRVRKRKRKSASRGKTSDAVEPCETEKQSSEADDQPSGYENIPKRRIKGSIHAGSIYFEQSTISRIEVNYLPIVFSNKNMQIYHYDIEFPSNANKEIFRKLVAEMKRMCYHKRHPAYDGKKNLFAAVTPLFEDNEITRIISIEDASGSLTEYMVTVKKVAELTLSNLYRYMMENGCSTNRPQSTIQAIEVAFRSGLPDHFTSCGRGMYEPPEPGYEKKLSSGLQLYDGFVQGAVLGQTPFLNMDGRAEFNGQLSSSLYAFVSHRGFYTAQSLLDYLRDTIRRKTPRHAQPDYRALQGGLPSELFKTLDSYVKQNNGLKMRYIDPRTNATRTYRIKGIHNKNALETTFNYTPEGSTNSQRISVKDYYETVKSYTIKYPRLPLIIRAGQKLDYFPLECCSIDEKQPVQSNYHYSSQETREMIENCKDQPLGRRDKILRNIEDAKFRENTVLREFGITLGDKSLVQVEAACLRPPSVRYKADFAARVQNGVWSAGKFVETQAITSWLFLNMNPSTTETDITRLTTLLMKSAIEVGMDLAVPLPPFPPPSSAEDSIEKSFRELKSKYRNLQLVMLILPGFETDLVYRRVKYVSEIKVGLLTQCVKPSTIQKATVMTAKNFLLKINSKLSGLNHKTCYPGSAEAIVKGDTMFVGADVTHPRPGSNPDSERSISAVAGSYDFYGSKYKMLYSVQESRQEMIKNMEMMIRALLLFFKEKNQGKFPSKMFYYRDGVSDGQFLMVLNTEMSAIKQACQKLGADVKVIFLVVQKRHHTRLFPPRSGILTDKKGNVMAGTVVNNLITHPSEHDFFMVSHESIQGTARPTKYHVLYDEIGIPEDRVEAFTYYLCYMFVRCTRAVSYPAPTYYAHLAAARAEKYVKCVKDKNVTHLLNRDLSKGPLGEGTIHENMRDKNPMFFV